MCSGKVVHSTRRTLKNIVKQTLTRLKTVSFLSKFDIKCLGNNKSLFPLHFKYWVKYFVTKLTKNEDLVKKIVVTVLLFKLRKEVKLWFPQV